MTLANAIRDFIKEERKYSGYFFGPRKHRRRIVRVFSFAIEEAFMFYLLLVLVPVICLIRLLRPVKLVRFGKLANDRIGHFAGITHLDVHQRRLNPNGKPRSWDIFYLNGMISNTQLAKMWKRVLFITPFARILARVNSYVPGYETHTIRWPLYLGGYQHYKKATPYPVASPYLFFTPGEERQGIRELKKMGIQEGAPFVCFHVRDQAYLKKTFPVKNWHYHNYRDADVKNYFPALDELSRRGYYLIRMGKFVNEPLGIKNDRIIDYASRYQSDFLDIYLISKCSFFIGCGSGIDELAKCFRRPLIYLNYSVFDTLTNLFPVELFIPKRFWLKKEKRYLKFNEILDSGIQSFLHTEKYEEYGLELIENTPEEIYAAVIEIDGRLKGTWETSEEDEMLQAKFRSLFNKDLSRAETMARIGSEFLRQHKELLN